jgi:hypothetical protein
MTRPPRWQIVGAIYVASVCALASFALTRGDTYSYNLYLLLLVLTLPVGAFVPPTLFMTFGMLAVVFNVPLTGAESPFEGAWFVVIDVAAFGLAAVANVCLTRGIWLSLRGCRSRRRMLHSRV